MSDLTERLDAIEARSAGLTDLCAEHLRQSIRHVQRNCDIPCNIHEDEDTWDDCKQPDRYDGDRMAALLADIPFLLDGARKQQAALDAVLEWCDTNQHPFHPSEGAEGFSSQDWALDDAARRIRTAVNAALEAKP